MKPILLSAFVLVGASTELSYLSVPDEQWLSAAPPLGDGNSVSLTPDESLVIVTSSDGTISAIHPNTASLEWHYRPSNIQGLPMFSTSGVTFSYTPMLGTYMIYGVSDGFAQADPSDCRVVALSLAGEVLWESAPLPGACSGTPVASEDGLYVFLTHNLVSVGHFSVLQSQENGTELYGTVDPNQPYAPLGIFFNPDQGYYMGGESNRNDILIWGYRPRFGEIGVGTSRTFVFQFPISFRGLNESLGVRPLLNVTWQTLSPPKITNNGYAMYTAVSRNQFRAWNGFAGNRPTQFDRLASQNFEVSPRGNPAWQAVFASPALSSDPRRPMLFGGTATNKFVAMQYNLSTMWEFPTTTTIRSEAVISPDDAVVYFAEDNGMVHAVNVGNGTEIWHRFADNSPVRSKFAVSNDGIFLYIGDLSGSIVKWRVAFGPSEAPSMVPSSMPSVSPTTSFPSSSPTATPTASPTVVSSSNPSSSPTVSQTAAPSIPLPSVDPSAAPSTPPSGTPSSFPTTVPSMLPTPVGTTSAPTTAAPASSAASMLVPVLSSLIVAVVLLPIVIQ